ncbi:hypothetical protein FKP32DRAFT_26270 [Trametes sanguinea]|nr:hypothetical protein FKP32DRAFT_26270 [Trametes sanguinea]
MYFKTLRLYNLCVCLCDTPASCAPSHVRPFQVEQPDPRGRKPAHHVCAAAAVSHPSRNSKTTLERPLLYIIRRQHAFPSL